MSQSATAALRFAPPARSPLAVDFLGGRLTSDGGLPWLAEADARAGALRRAWRPASPSGARGAACATRCWSLCGSGSSRSPAATRTRTTPTRLRADPLLKLVCGRLPDSGPDLASQPTLSRLENAVDRHGTATAWPMALGEVYLRERERDGAAAPASVLDLDGTDDPTHGEQEGSAYHGYYRQHMYHPLLVFDGDTGQLITAVLRPGNAHASAGVVAVLRRLVRRPARALAAAWRSSCAPTAASPIPALYACCEREGIAYTIGLIPNARLERRGRPAPGRGAGPAAAADGAKVRLLARPATRPAVLARARAASSSRPRLWPKGPNTRFVVTTRADPPLALYDWYVDRGEAENWIKDLKDRLLRRPPELPSLLGQPVPPAAARRRLLAARHPAPLAGAGGHRADAAGHPAPAPAQDRRPRPPTRRARPSAPRLQPSRRAALAPPRHPRPGRS